MRREVLILALAATAIAVLAVGVALATWGWTFVLAAAGAGALGGAVFAGPRLARRLTTGQRRATRPAAGPPLGAESRPLAGPALAAAPLARLQELSPAEFEEFTRLLFAASGVYHDVRRVGRSGDGGVDLTMRDPAGNLCVVQCKRYRGTVPAAQIRDLAGVMMLYRPREAFLVTTGRVSQNAQAVVGNHLIHLWDGARLVEYAQQYLGDRFEETIKRARGEPRAHYES